MASVPVKRLLFIAEHFAIANSGAENDLVTLCQALVKRGHELHVASETHDKLEGITPHRGLANVKRIVDAVKPDIIIDWGFFCQADIHRIGGGVHEHFQRYSIQAYPPILRPFKRLEGQISRKHQKQAAREKKILANKSATFLPISDFVARQLYESGVAESAVTVLYNGVDTSRYNNEPAPETRKKLRGQWGVSQDDTVFLFIAHNLKLKNLKLLHRVFNALYNYGYTSLKLVVIGKRAPKFTSPYLIYGGATKRIEECYMAADGLLHPTYYDAFANVVLEAMSCALPVVVSNHAGVCELIKPGVNGMVLPVIPGSQARTQWISAVKSLVDNPEQAKKLGSAARETALQHDYEQYVDRFEEIIHRKARFKKAVSEN